MSQETQPLRKLGTAQRAAPAGAAESEEGPTEATEGDQLLESFNNLSPLVRIQKSMMLKMSFWTYKNWSFEK